MAQQREQLPTLLQPLSTLDDVRLTHELSGFAATGSLSEDGLKHFKTYKYSSVDKSPVSHYILRHYVCTCFNLDT